MQECSPHQCRFEATVPLLPLRRRPRRPAAGCPAVSSCASAPVLAISAIISEAPLMPVSAAAASLAAAAAAAVTSEDIAIAGAAALAGTGLAATALAAIAMAGTASAGTTSAGAVSAGAASTAAARFVAKSVPNFTPARPRRTPKRVTLLAATVAVAASGAPPISASLFSSSVPGGSKICGIAGGGAGTNFCLPASSQKSSGPQTYMPTSVTMVNSAPLHGGVFCLDSLTPWAASAAGDRCAPASWTRLSLGPLTPGVSSSSHSSGKDAAPAPGLRPPTARPSGPKPPRPGTSGASWMASSRASSCMKLSRAASASSSPQSSSSPSSVSAMATRRQPPPSLGHQGAGLMRGGREAGRAGSCTPPAA
mmetsp:Transcript_29769/g.75776  ORF Transcript_29769/g.75776 Transcript_29769/m.75776 type:complete len:366 (+) Transcript_29769:89-1186(+)